MPQYPDVPDDTQYTGGGGGGRRTTTEPLVPAQQAEPMTTMTTSLPISMHRQLKIASVMHNVKIKDIVHEALQKWLDEHPVER